MKNSATIFVFFYLILFLSSCNEKEHKNSILDAEEIVIDAKNQTALPYDSIITKIDYIKLETTDTNLIGQISQLLFIDSLIVVVDQEIAQSAYVFDLTGKFLYSIGKKGNGPGEYVEPTHIAYDPLNDRFSLFDKHQNRIIHYSRKGTYLSSEKTPFMMYDFEYLTNGYRAYNKGGMDDISLGKFRLNPLIVTNEENHPIYGDCHVPYKPNVFTYTTATPLRTFEGEVYFYPDLSNIFYLVTDSGVIPKYHINIVWNGMPAVDDNITDEMFREYCDKYFIFNGDIIELKDFSYINIMTRVGYPFVLYSHNQKKTYFCNDQTSHPIHPFLVNNEPIARYRDNTVVFDLSSDFLFFNREELNKNYPSYNSWLDGLYDGITEDSNPVLVLCQINEEL